MISTYSSLAYDKDRQDTAWSGHFEKSKSTCYSVLQQPTLSGLGYLTPHAPMGRNREIRSETRKIRLIARGSIILARPNSNSDTSVTFPPSVPCFILFCLCAAFVTVTTPVPLLPSPGLPCRIQMLDRRTLSAVAEMTV